MPKFYSKATQTAHRLLTIIADENITGLNDYFANHKNVRLIKMSGRAITDSLWEHKPHALLIRSVTPITPTTFIGHHPLFIGTATIGTDHVDKDYLTRLGIGFADAKGSSKHSVAQYVITAILTAHPELLSWRTPPIIGIVGLGNIGQLVAWYAKKLGFVVLGYDPFLPKAGDNNARFDDILKADIISVHTPLTNETQSNYPTYHLFNSTVFDKLNPNALFINTARGQIVSESALLDWLKHPNACAVLDVYEHEPDVPAYLLDRLELATPHIAGYTLDGKLRGTDMIYRAFCQYFGLPIQYQYTTLLSKSNYRFSDLLDSLQQGDIKTLTRFYDIRQDDKALRAVSTITGVNKIAFDSLRKRYGLRREWQVR